MRLSIISSKNNRELKQNVLHLLDQIMCDPSLNRWQVIARTSKDWHTQIQTHTHRRRRWQYPQAKRPRIKTATKCHSPKIKSWSSKWFHKMHKVRYLPHTDDDFPLGTFSSKFRLSSTKIQIRELSCWSSHLNISHSSSLHVEDHSASNPVYVHPYLSTPITAFRKRQFRLEVKYTYLLIRRIYSIIN